MQASFYIIVHNGFSMNFSIRGSSAYWLHARMVHVTALDIQVSLRNPTAILEDSMTSLKTLYTEPRSVADPGGGATDRRTLPPPPPPILIDYVFFLFVSCFAYVDNAPPYSDESFYWLVVVLVMSCPSGEWSKRWSK